VEVMRALAEEAGQIHDIGQVQLPDTILTQGIHDIVRRRLNRVPDWAYSALQVAALMGRTLDLAVLDIVLSPMLSIIVGTDISISVSTAWRTKRAVSLEDWLLVCADAAILEVHDDEWRFSHDKLREQILADIDPELDWMFRSRIKKAMDAMYKK
jgi:eukaryotic-like serine/threonine-protein kinase